MVEWLGHMTRSNLSSDERKAIHELKADRDIMVLPADKGKAMVVMNTSEYKQKFKKLLDDTSVYEVLKKDPTTAYKNRLVKILREWKREETISDNKYQYITRYIPPQMAYLNSMACLRYTKQIHTSDL